MAVYELQDIRRYSTPIAGSFYADHKDLKEESVIPNEHYRSMIGSLMFLATRTRPDMSNSVGILSKHVANLTVYY